MVFPRQQPRLGKLSNIKHDTKCWGYLNLGQLGANNCLPGLTNTTDFCPTSSYATRYHKGPREGYRMPLTFARSHLFAWLCVVANPSFLICSSISVHCNFTPSKAKTTKLLKIMEVDRKTFCSFIATDT